MATQVNPITDAQQAPPAQIAPEQDAGNDVSLPDDSTAADSVNLHRSFSRLNEAIIKLADGAGVPRSVTLPHQDGQNMAAHISAVSQALTTAGGITNNLLTSTHSKYGSDGGVTVGYPAEKLRQTIIPKNSENAKLAIDACRSFIGKVEKLIGETPEIKLAKSQIDIVGRHGGVGMNLVDLIVSLINIPAPVIQAIARAHSGNKQDGHSPALRAPKEV